MKRLLYLGFLATALTQASTITLTPIADGQGTIGALDSFAVVNGTVTTDSTGVADIFLNFNYRAPGLNGPATDLGTYSEFGVNLSATDLTFQVGNHAYGIAIADHSGSPNGANSALFATAVHGHFYQSSSLLTAQTVLNNPSLGYRNSADVWLGGSLTDLGTLTETVTHNPGATPNYTVELRGQLPVSFLADVTAQNGLNAEFGSATCGNGYLVGSLSGSLGTPTPEPMSLALMGSGLITFGLIARFRSAKGSRAGARQ